MVFEKWEVFINFYLHCYGVILNFRMCLEVSALQCPECQKEKSWVFVLWSEFELIRKWQPDKQ